MATFKLNVLTYSIDRTADQPDLTVVNTPAKVVEVVRLKSLIPDDGKEHFGILLLDARNRLLGWHHVSIGSVAKVNAEPRDIFTPALLTPGCISLILVHNHPTGETEPSPEDVKLTLKLTRAGQLLDLRVLDHIIVGRGPEWTFTSIIEWFDKRDQKKAENRLRREVKKRK